jgi:gluconolactonase
MEDLAARHDEDCNRIVDAMNYEGMRLNSSKAFVYKSDGSLYFTDPPFGLLGQDRDPG